MNVDNLSLPCSAAIILIFKESHDSRKLLLAVTMAWICWNSSPFPDHASAKKHAEKMIVEKTKKRYVEGG
jgi:predicted DNA-binding WGR domain protein